MSASWYTRYMTFVTPTATKASKAIVGAVVGGVTAFLTALSVILVGDVTVADVTQGQWVVVALGTLAGLGLTGGAVYQTTNAPK